MNPLSMLFGAGVALRNALYDRGIFNVHKLARPVVSIGNISVGGSGKTPFVIALGELLKQRGIGFDVLSRGYGRSSSETAVVDPGGTPQQYGDEPLLIARKLQVPVVVGGDRYKAGLLAEKRSNARLHLLDDGFQHRRLHRDFDIILLPKNDLTDTLLPGGRLREPISALRRADAIVSFDDIDLSNTDKPTAKVRRVITFERSGASAFAFCAIARPHQFLDSLGIQGQEISGRHFFRDHHRYTQADVERLLQLKERAGAGSFITTEKDLINLGRLAAQLEPLRTAELRIELEAPEHFLNVILETIERRTLQSLPPA
jgi:tetraacyldisaccharide 4'-kinase